jgi:hypothetical protein
VRCSGVAIDDPCGLLRGQERRMASFASRPTGLERRRARRGRLPTAAGLRGIRRPVPKRVEVATTSLPVSSLQHTAGPVDTSIRLRVMNSNRCSQSPPRRRAPPEQHARCVRRQRSADSASMPLIADQRRIILICCCCRPDRPATAQIARPTFSVQRRNARIQLRSASDQ